MSDLCRGANAALICHRCNRVRHGDRSLRFFQVQQLGHFAIHFQYAFASIGRISEGFDHRLGLFYIRRIRGKDTVGSIKL